MPWMTSNCTTVKIRKTLVILKTFRNNYVRSSSDCSLQSVLPWPPLCVFTFIRPVPTPARVHLFCTCALPPSSLIPRHSSYHSLKLTAPLSCFTSPSWPPPPSPTCLPDLYEAVCSSHTFHFWHPSAHHHHLPLLQLDSHICARSFIFVILGWEEEEGGWERWDNRRSVVFAEEARLSFHILHRLLSALIGVLSEYVCVCKC